MKKISLLAVALTPFIGASALSAQDSVATDPVGFVNTDLTDGYTAVGVNIVKPAVFSSLVVSTDGDTVTLSDEPTLDGGVQYYLEVADGALEGDRIDIASASGDEITLNLSSGNNTLDTNALEADSRVIIREHFTFADISDIVGDDLHTGASFPDSSDQIVTWESGAFVSHAVFDGDWFDAGGNPVNDKVLAPGTGFMFYVNPDAPGRNIELMVLGEVRNNDFVRPLDSGYQMVSTGFPTDESPASLMITDENFTGGSDPSTADKIVVWDSGSFSENWMFTDGSWYDSGGNPVSDEDLFPANGAVLVNLQGTDPDFRVTNRVDME